MLCENKEVKPYFLVKGPCNINNTEANHNLGQIPAAGTSQQGGRH